MTISFHDEFVDEIVAIYKRHAPLVRRHEPSISTDFHWLSVNFGIVHYRGMDDIFIRYDDHLEVDLSAGAGAQIVCLKNASGLYWLPLSGVRKSELCESEKKDVERIVAGVYELCEERREMLKVLLGGAIAIEYGPIEADFSNEWG